MLQEPLLFQRKKKKANEIENKNASIIMDQIKSIAPTTDSQEDTSLQVRDKKTNDDSRENNLTAEIEKSELKSIQHLPKGHTCRLLVKVTLVVFW
jgi:hypothetical protein